MQQQAIIVLYVLQVYAVDMSDVSVAAQDVFQRLKKAVVGQASLTCGVDANGCSSLGTLLWRHALCPNLYVLMAMHSPKLAHICQSTQKRSML